MNALPQNGDLQSLYETYLLFFLQQHIKLPFKNTATLCAMSKNLVSVILQRRKNRFFYDERDKTRYLARCMCIYSYYVIAI